MNSHPQASTQRFARRFFVALTLLYVALFFLWQLAVKSPLYNALWWLQVSQIFGMVGYLPLALLLPGAIAIRNRWALLGLAIPLIWFGLEYGALFLPNTPAQPANEQEATLRVMTWNAANTIGYWGNTTDELEAAVARVHPDIILLQEMGSDTVEQLQVLAEEFPYRRYGLGGGRARIALGSKWQIVDEKLDEDPQGCHCLRVTLDWNGQMIDVVTVHVKIATYNMTDWRGLPLVKAFDATAQSSIFDGLIALAPTERPLVIAGDFNTTERQPNYERMLKAGFQDAHDEGGWGFGLTFPRPGAVKQWWLFPLIRIDHIFYNDKWVAQRTRTGFMRSSDHLYVVTDLQLRGAK